jgi:hypothetical protein
MIETTFDTKLYGTCCNYAYYCLKKLNITQYKSQDVVNEFYFNNDVNNDNYKNLIYSTIRKLSLKPLPRYETEFTPKINHVKETLAQCIKCNEVKPLDMFYKFRLNPSKKCKQCICIENNRDYKIKSFHRLLRKNSNEIDKLDEIINLCNQKKQEILKNELPITQ